MRRTWTWTLVLLMGGCCIQPTPMPMPIVPIDIVDLPIPAGPPAWPDAGFFALSGTFGEDWARLPPRVRLERGFAGGQGAAGGLHLDVRYELRNASPPLPPSSLVFISRMRRVSDSRVVGRGEITTTVQPSDGGYVSVGATRVRLCPTARGVNILGEPLVLESYVLEGGTPDPKLLVEQKQPVQVECSGCEPECGG